MFSQTAEYALRAMAWLSVLDHELIPTPVLAHKAQVPPNYLAKVLQQLAAAKLITGRRGVGGGYKLARPASEITLLDVVRCVAPVERVQECPLGKAMHGGRLCPLHQVKDRAAAAVIEVLGGVTLRDLQRDPDHPLCAGPGRAPRLAIPA
jgi:Rrf2 family nitric oxide-sensitive transcriptional repressor